MTHRSQRVYVHIGLPKTGTTSLQALLWHHREALAADGVLYPGADDTAQHKAAIDVHPQRFPQWNEPGVKGSWDWLVEQVRAWQGTSLISSELLAPASPEEARRVLSALSFAEIHVVCTVRDFARQVPSVWQENIKTRDSTTLEEFLAHLRGGELTDVSTPFWDFQDLPRVLRTWGGSLPPERVHVVTVPPKGAPSELLWQRFATVLGVDAGKYTTDVPQENFSLGLAETELLRRVNVALGPDMPWPRYAGVVKDTLAAKVLAELDGSTRIALPPGDHGWVADTARRFVDAVAEAGYHVVGDVDDLIPALRAEGTGTAVDMPDDAVLLETAVAAIARLIHRVPSPPPPGAGQRGVHRIKGRLRDLSEQHPQAMRARRFYWRAKARLRSSP
ncbi:hypothetical protein SacmaDRAFT_2939 [Saccharomonospora marina XMU15]|uniref:Sulfotransferase family protein n=1 Tax=Saccharomonospora marina XMU15 TaxID=882083 RepID=H5X5M9_9PSEU|nr:hypothetical protein [Saccharomonospora marina]EHR51177.1 hypothetical protein SacmaDRAFT_2939 [Saccharomonospora marina XMU15]